MFDSSGLMKWFRIATLYCGSVLLASCSDGGAGNPSPPPGGQRNVVISWSANHESAVNRTGGGYKVYYNNTPNFLLGNATQVDVPYVSGPSSPFTTTLVLASGTYYIKVVAYSTMNPTGSVPSTEMQVVVP